jgi:hypothetical protein
MSTTYGRPFDVKAAYGEVHGGSIFAFSQGGQLYNIHKMPVDGQGNELPLAPPKAPVVAPVVALDPIDPALIATGDTRRSAPIEATVDLVAWAAGDVTAPWPLLQKEVKRQTGESSRARTRRKTPSRNFRTSPETA